MEEDSESEGLANWGPVEADLIRQAQDQPSASIKEIGTYEVLEILTERTTFVVAVTDPKASRAVMSSFGDLQFEPTEVILCGSSWGTALCKPGILVVGMRMEFAIGRARFTTTEVLTIRRRQDPKTARGLTAIATLRRNEEIGSVRHLWLALKALWRKFWRI